MSEQVGTTRMAAVAGHFGRDVERGLAKALGIIASARTERIDLLVLPHATLGGYLGDLRDPVSEGLPELLAVDGPEIAAITRAAGPMTVCIGYSERADEIRYNAAVCVSGDGVLGRHRKVHQPAGESSVYASGDEFRAFQTPVGPLGMLIDYDKTFPESARTLALEGARIIASLSAWPASVTDRASRLDADRQSRLFDLYDSARAAENQVFLVSANQTGVTGNLRFLGRSKVIGPGGDVLASTGAKGGLATVTVDVDAEVLRARRVLNHLGELRPNAYRTHPVSAAVVATEAATEAATAPKGERA